MLKKLVLFDIDGTLLKVGSVNRRILVDALTEVYGTPGSAESHNFAGKMDSVIIYEVLRNAGLPDEEIASLFDKARETYIEMFRSNTRPSDVTLLAGVRKLLEALSDMPEIFLGLLTGNFEGSGRHKLELPGINHFFTFGAFADDGRHRNELPPAAVEKAFRLTGKIFTGKDVVIIGDTEHDVMCARAYKTRSIAVASGTYSAEELKKHEPDVLLENLSSTGVVINEILRS
ncbi:MAG: HAD hydrolase-like protein [Chlorobiaceae bacterium]|nr:HAD hydrolase-like protein [Chlorobiaceae bacterium]